jgi:preprotein translocase subunit SecE
VGLNRKANDFFIATEGEMKKVNWSSRQEIVRSTKVVVVTVILFGAFLFLADVLFMEFFSAIKVLQTPSMLRRLFGQG